VTASSRRDGGGGSPATPGAPRSRPRTWEGARELLRSRGMRWTPQRRLILDVLAATRGHVTGSDVLERCLALDPATTPSTVYRTLDVLEELGYVHHSHRPDGREEYHVLPAREHGHLVCSACGGVWEIGASEAGELVTQLGAARGFEVELGHLTIVGRCAACGRRA
jgi:Fur family ferric uptake transcriptional regulator